MTSRTNDEYRSVDLAALEDALLALLVCPRCRRDLLPVVLVDDVWGCRGGATHTPETWYLPEVDS